MKSFRVLLSAIVGIAASLGADNAGAAPADKEVKRDRALEVQADPDSARMTFSAHGKPFLTDCRTSEGALAAQGKALTFAPRGGGSGIVVQHGDGHADSVEWDSSSPFALLRTSVANEGKQPSVVRKVRTFQGKIDLGLPVDQLRILGTGGLSKPGNRTGSYAWMAIADPQSRKGIVVGWIRNDRSSGVLFAEASDRGLEIEAVAEFGRLSLPPGGKEECAGILAIGHFDDIRLGLEAWADLVARHNGIKLPAQPSGYCTWYHAGASNETAMVKQTEIAARELAPYGFDFLQIDDGWQDGVSRNGPKKNFTRVRPGGPYPSGMKRTADAIKSHGLTPGIWFMPFAGTHDDPWFKDKQAWFARRDDGKPFDTPWGGTCMDMTHPEARKYLYDYVHRISRDWGYRFFKMDGLSTGCAVKPQYVNLAYKDDNLGESVLHDPSKTHIEAFRSGLKLVREAAGDSVFLLGCCAAQNMRSYGAAYGLVDAMRVGPDNGGGSWRSVLTGPRIASRHYHLNGRIWYNDPDVVYVRNSLTLDQARANASWVAVTGQLFLVSDDFARLSPERLELLKRVMPAHGCLARPVDLLEAELPRIWLVTDSRSPRRDVIGLFNWDETRDWEVDLPLDRIGLPPGKRFVAFDFWGNRLLPAMEGRLGLSVPRSSCRILAVRPEADHPQLISTSRHVTQGIVDVTDEAWDDAAKTLRGVSRVVPGDRYELRIATGGKTRKVARIESSLKSPEPTTATEEGLVRVQVQVPAGQKDPWRWAVQFDH